MQSRELVLGGVEITEKDFFPEAKEALAGDIQAFLAAQGMGESPTEPNENLEKSVKDERNFLFTHFHTTLEQIPGLDAKKVRNMHSAVAHTLYDMADEASERSDLPDNFTDRVAAYLLLELATPEAKTSYNLSTLFDVLDKRVEGSGSLTAEQAELLRTMTESSEQISGPEWQRKYAVAAKNLAHDLQQVGVGLWEGEQGASHIEEVENVFSAWANKLPKKEKSETGELMGGVVFETYRQYADQFGKTILQELSEGKNGKAMLAKVTEFVAHTVRARELVSSEAKRKILGKDTYSLIGELSQYKHGMFSAMLLVGWHEGESGSYVDMEGNPQIVREEVAIDNNRYLYLHDLVKYVDRDVIDAMGSVLMSAKNPAHITDLLEDYTGTREGKVLQDWPTWTLSRVADCFVDADYITKSKFGEYKLKKKSGVYVSNLSFDSIRSVMLAYQYMTVPESAKPIITSLDDADKIYEDNKELIKVEQLDFDITGPGTLHLSDALYGHKDLNSRFLTKEIKRITTLPESERPSVVVMSDLVFGTFIVNNNKKRRAFAQGAKHLETQFALANKAVTQLAEAGIKVVILQGDNAFAIADDHTIKNVQRLTSLAKPLLGTNEVGHIDYATANRIRQDKMFDKHFTFEWEVIYPYCIRSGRSLLNADEVFEKTNGAVRMEEYLILFDAYEKQLAGEEIPSEYLDVINFDNITFPGKKFNNNIHIVDDAHINMKNTDGSTRYSSRVFARFGLSPQTMPTDPITKLKTFMTAMSAEGEAPPDFSVLTNQKFLVGLQGDNDSWALSTPGLQETNINEKGSILRTAGDISWRQVMRGVTAKPATLKYDRDAEDTVTYEISNDLLNQKSEATPPTTIAFLHDLQIGSHTAHLDLPVKALDYIVSNIAPYEEIVLGMNGDISHGLNHPGSAIQNGPTLLNGLDPQQKMGERMFKGALDHFNHAQLENVKKVLVTLGNHEWNSGNKDFGSTHSLWIQDAFADVLSSKVGPGELQKELRERVSFHDTMHTQDGDFLVNAWTALEPVGAYNLMMQHLILDKMAKGPGGPAILQLKSLISGLGSLIQNIDLFEFGHWHNGQFMLFGNKAGAVAPATDAGESYYEWIRAYRPKTGLFLMRIGSDQPGKPKPVRFQFVSTRALHNHQIKDGVFSQESLASRNYFDDPNFNPMKDGYADKLGLHSALQKQLWRMAEEIAYGHPYSV